MGLEQTQMFATVFDGITRHSPEGLWFKRYAETFGFQAAAEWRDSGRPIPSRKEVPDDRAHREAGQGLDRDPFAAGGEERDGSGERRGARVARSSSSTAIAEAAVAVLWGEGGAFCAGFDLKHCRRRGSATRSRVDYPAG